MAWVGQKELDAAVDAMIACAKSLTTHDRQALRIIHDSQKIERRQWENIICSALQAASRYSDIVMPKNTYLFQSNSVEQEKVSGGKSD